MKNKFDGMTNYTAVCQLTPDVYGFVNTVTLVGEDNGKEVYRMPKTVQQYTAYSPIRDRMYIGMHVAYIAIVNRLKNKPINNGDLKYYWLVAVETANDKPRRILSFDAYIIQKDSYEELLKSPEFAKIPGVNDEKKHSAVFVLGKQYAGDMELIDVEHMLLHMKAYKHTPVRIEKFSLENDLTFDFESEGCQQFIQNAFTGTDRNVYSIGLDITSHSLFDISPEEVIANDTEDAVKKESEQETEVEEPVYNDPGNLLGQFKKQEAATSKEVETAEEQEVISESTNNNEETEKETLIRIDEPVAPKENISIKSQTTTERKVFEIDD